MFQWITGQKEPPQEVAAMKTFQVRPPSFPRRALAPASGLTGCRRSRSTPSCGPS